MCRSMLYIEQHKGMSKTEIGTRKVVAPILQRKQKSYQRKRQTHDKH